MNGRKNGAKNNSLRLIGLFDASLYAELDRMTNRAVDGAAETATLDDLARPTIITNILGRFTNAYAGVTARITTNLYPNGEVRAISYYATNGDLRLQTIWNQTPSGSTISKFDYTYDADGQVKTWTQQVGTNNATVLAAEYDSADQLIGAAIHTNTVAGSIIKQFVYGYDKTGNRTSESIESGATCPAVNSGTFNTLDQLTALAVGGSIRFKGHLSETGTVQVAGSPATMTSATNFTGYAQLTLGTNTNSIVATDLSANSATNRYQLIVTNNGLAQTLTYDLNGNLTSAVSASYTNTYEWDAANRLVAINSGANRTEFTYDGLSRRVRIVEKTNGVVQTDKRFVWAGAGLAEERDSTGTNVTKRFFDSGEQISGTNYFFTGDHLGSVRELTDASGSVRARYDYDPYGRRTKTSGDLEADFGFTGHYFHPASGLHLALYRAYDANTSRWLSRDPLEAGNNFYSYVENDPLNLIDSLGLCDSHFSDDFWVNVYEHGADDAGRFFKRIGQAALLPTLSFYKRMFNPIGAFFDDLNSLRNFASYVGTLSADGCERARAWNQFKDYLVSPEGIADATMFIESILGGKLAAGETAEGAILRGSCFAAGTKISTPAGDVNIEDIKSGDTVYAYDFDERKVVEERVEKTHQNFTYHWVEVEAGGNTIVATKSHPFWVESEQRWLKAVDLKRGMELRRGSGETAAITSTKIRDLDQPETTFNFEVSHQHDYFVGGIHVLVHNGDGSYTIHFKAAKRTMEKAMLGVPRAPRLELVARPAIRS